MLDQLLLETFTPLIGQTFTVPAPQPAQRLRIIEQTMAALVRKTGHCIGLAPGAPEQLSQRMDIDLRQLHRLVSAAFASACCAGGGSISDCMASRFSSTWSKTLRTS